MPKAPTRKPGRYAMFTIDSVIVFLLAPADVAAGGDLRGGLDASVEGDCGERARVVIRVAGLRARAHRHVFGDVTAGTAR